MPGKPDGSREINLDGHRFKVRRNLFDFLDRAAQTFPHQLHWIGAWRIDQGSIEEKNAQIRKMGSIYRKAQTVYVWLGNDLALWLFAYHADQIKKKGLRMYAGYCVMTSWVACWFNLYWSRTSQLPRRYVSLVQRRRLPGRRDYRRTHHKLVD